MGVSSFHLWSPLDLRFDLLDLLTGERGCKKAISSFLANPFGSDVGRDCFSGGFDVNVCLSHGSNKRPTPVRSIAAKIHGRKESKGTWDMMRESKMTESADN